MFPLVDDLRDLPPLNPSLHNVRLEEESFEDFRQIKGGKTFISVRPGLRRDTGPLRDPETALFGCCVSSGPCHLRYAQKLGFHKGPFSILLSRVVSLFILGRPDKTRGSYLLVNRPTFHQLFVIY